MKFIGIVGSRRRNGPLDLKAVYDAFVRIYDPEDILVSGGCPKGADAFAQLFADKMHIPILIHWPDKSKLPEHPERWNFAQINFDRNTLIARDSDVLIACVASDRTGGTEDTIRKFLKMGKKELVIV